MFRQRNWTPKKSVSLGLVLKLAPEDLWLPEVDGPSETFSGWRGLALLEWRMEVSNFPQGAEGLEGVNEKIQAVMLYCRWPG